MAKLAKLLMFSLYLDRNRNTTSFAVYGDDWSIYIDEIKVTGEYINTIHNQGHHMHKYWNKNGRFLVSEQYN